MLLTGVIGLALSCGSAFAQAADQSPDQAGKQGSANLAAKSAGQTMTITGCLQERGKDEYRISGDDGKSWALKSTSVKLGDHLNHKVTITGKVTKEGAGAEAGDLDVSNLKMVSQSCQ